MMEKRGVITDQTPQEKPQPRPVGQEPATKEAADRMEDHPATRAADAVAQAAAR